MSFVDNEINVSSMSMNEYKAEYEKSIKEPDVFWSEKASTLSWIKKFTKVKESSFNDKVSIKWFSDGALNASFNCVDRHLKDKGNKTAIIWERVKIPLSGKRRTIWSPVHEKYRM